MSAPPQAAPLWRALWAAVWRRSAGAFERLRPQTNGKEALAAAQVRRAPCIMPRGVPISTAGLCGRRRQMVLNVRGVGRSTLVHTCCRVNACTDRGTASVQRDYQLRFERWVVAAWKGMGTKRCNLAQHATGVRTGDAASLLALTGNSTSSRLKSQLDCHLSHGWKMRARGAYTRVGIVIDRSPI